MKSFILLVALNLVGFSTIAQTTIIKQNIKVAGSCGMCKNIIESSLKVPGVLGAVWSPDTKVLKLKYIQAIISLDSIQHLVALAGYDNDMYRATDSTYFSLHKCCQYERKK